MGFTKMFCEDGKKAHEFSSKMIFERSNASL